MAHKTIKSDTKHNHKQMKHKALNAYIQRLWNFNYAGFF
jgi:hypothetical protein